MLGTFDDAIQLLDPLRKRSLRHGRCVRVAQRVRVAQLLTLQSGNVSLSLVATDWLYLRHIYIYICRRLLPPHFFLREKKSWDPLTKSTVLEGRRAGCVVDSLRVLLFGDVRDMDCAAWPNLFCCGATGDHRNLIQNLKN